MDRRLQAVVLRCLEKSPERRFASAGELADALEKCRRPRRGRWVAAAAVLAMGSWWFVRESDPENRYGRRVLPLLARLDQGEEVDLIPAGGSVPPPPAASAPAMG